jgi:hypothetical protein
MKPILNQQTILWIIGVLQPVSAREVTAYISAVLKNAGQLPEVEQLQKFCLEQSAIGRLLRVTREPDLFSLTTKGNDYLTKKHRHSRDKARLFLLKDARKGRINVSREGTASGLDGVAPSVDERPIIKGREANKPGPVVPSGQAYWPRFSQQLIEETGLSQPSRDIPFIPLLSFADAGQVRLAADIEGSTHELDYHSLGLMLGISPRLIVTIVVKPERHYRSFDLPKKGGGTRPIESPRTFLKVIQQFLVDYYLNGLPVHGSVQSYRKNYSIISNAEQHCRKPFVANIDIENYFGSIEVAGVINLLRRVGYDAKSADIVGRLCTKDGVLPQGAPTSPALSNAYLLDFDTAISEQCIARKLTYTRYADDITISGKDKDEILQMIAFARDFLLKEYSLVLNEDKTRVASQHGQQKVTGVVVNESPRPPRRFRRQVRAAFYNAFKEKIANKETIDRLNGYLSYLNSFAMLSETEELSEYRNILFDLRKRIPQTQK